MTVDNIMNEFGIIQTKINHNNEELTVIVPRSALDINMPNMNMKK